GQAQALFSRNTDRSHGALPSFNPLCGPARTRTSRAFQPTEYSERSASVEGHLRCAVLYLKLTQTTAFAILIIMRTNLNISLPPALKQWVEEQIDQGGYGTASEYIRQLIREERKRQGRVRVEAKLQEALDSGEPRTVNAATWKESDKRVE